MGTSGSQMAGRVAWWRDMGQQFAVVWEILVQVSQGGGATIFEI